MQSRQRPRMISVALMPKISISGRLAMNILYLTHCRPYCNVCKVRIDLKTNWELLGTIKVESDIPDRKLLNPSDNIFEVFSDVPPQHLHIIVRRPGERVQAFVRSQGLIFMTTDIGTAKLDLKSSFSEEEGDVIGEIVNSTLYFLFSSIFHSFPPGYKATISKALGPKTPSKNAKSNEYKLH